MTALVLATCAPVTIATTVLAAEDFEYSPNISNDVFRHDANKFASALVKPGAIPTCRFKTPFLAAYTLMGLGLFRMTAFNFTFTNFTNFVRSAGSTHPQYALASSATAVARIMGASVNQKGILMADVVVVPLSSDGMVHPIAAPSNVALPTLSSEPALHTLGPVKINGTKYSGCRNAGFDLGNEFVAEPHDGDLYLRNVGEFEANPKLMAEHADPATVFPIIGTLGAAVTTTAILNFRDISAVVDSTQGTALGTGLSISISSGTVNAGPIRMRRGAMPTLGIEIQPLSATQTHPFTLNAAATMPAG